MTTKKYAFLSDLELRSTIWSKATLSEAFSRKVTSNCLPEGSEEYGETRWDDPKCHEAYSGQFLLGALHGVGAYSWRGCDPSLDATYEGGFHTNSIQGYGCMSYRDGRTYRGFFKANHRFGPGLETDAGQRTSVGLWLGGRLVRLSWTAAGAVPAPGRDAACQPLLQPVRTYLIAAKAHPKLLDELATQLVDANSAVELMKTLNMEGETLEKWNQLYSSRCTDPESIFYMRRHFDRAFYGDTVDSLEIVVQSKQLETEPKEVSDPKLPLAANGKNVTGKVSPRKDKDLVAYYYAWNNSEDIIEMMKHTYKHMFTMETDGISVEDIVSGRRQNFGPAGEAELGARAALLAARLGVFPLVARLCRQLDLHPELSDAQGNTLLMYAICGELPLPIVRYLLVRGASPDRMNDSCITPLGLTLLLYLATDRSIPYSSFPDAFFPVPAKKEAKQDQVNNVKEWNITRNVRTVEPTAQNSPPPKDRMMNAKHTTPQPSTEETNIKEERINADSTNDESENLQIFNHLENEYSQHLKSDQAISNNYMLGPVFQIADITLEVTGKLLNSDFDTKKKSPTAENPLTSKASSKFKPDTMTISSNSQSDEEEKRHKDKIARLKALTAVIDLLISKGARPEATLLPIPALAMSIFTVDLDIIQTLIQAGASPNERFPTLRNMTALQLLLSLPLEPSTVDISKILLDNGADVHQKYEAMALDANKQPVASIEDGPTLLHVAVIRTASTEPENDIKRQLITMFMSHGANALTQTSGRSCIDYAMTEVMDSNCEMLELLLGKGMYDLNVPINSANQSCLVKYYSIEYFKKLQVHHRADLLNLLLLSGADPLAPCHHLEENYKNIFEFTKVEDKKLLQATSKLAGKGSNSKKPPAPTKGPDKKKPQAPEPLKMQPPEEVLEYRAAVDQCVEFTRDLHARWIRSVLIRKLAAIVGRFRYRAWQMIVKEVDIPKQAALWLTTASAFAAWNSLRATKEPVYKDKRVLKWTLSIVSFFNMNVDRYMQTKRSLVLKVTTEESHSVEKEVTDVLKAEGSSQLLGYKDFTKPELVTDVARFEVCFQCCAPITPRSPDEVEGESPRSLVCRLCSLAQFCSERCLARSARGHVHACARYLLLEYPAPDEAE